MLKQSLFLIRFFNILSIGFIYKQLWGNDEGFLYVTKHLAKMNIFILKLLQGLSTNSVLLTKKQKKRIKFINFDSLVSNPKKELKKICLFLKTTKSNVTNKILKRENCPRKIDLVIRKKKFNFIKKKISQNSEKILLNIIEKYNSKKLFF